MVRRCQAILGFSVAVLVAAAALAQAGGAAKEKAAPKGGGKAPVIWPAGDLKWTDAPGAPPEVKQVTLWGDSTKGAYGAIQKFPAGFSAPLHTHSYDMRIVVVSGTFLHTPDGRPEVRLGPGSYLLQPANYRHSTGCDKVSECVFFLESPGKFDIKMVEEKKAPAKK
jgi:quercetin dioxygenase-like cupin family protein